jgi:uncharacterized protein
VRARELDRSDGGGGRTHVLIFETGDEIVGGLEGFAKREGLGGSQFVAIGALSDVVVAWFDWESKRYAKIPIHEQVEVLSLVGDIADAEGRPKVHAHIVVGKSDGSAHGGHLVEGHVRPTLELVLTESPQHLRRTFDPATGLALIRV